jgi:lipoprotein NlpI
MLCFHSGSASRNRHPAQRAAAVRRPAQPHGHVDFPTAGGGTGGGRKSRFLRGRWGAGFLILCTVVFGEANAADPVAHPLPKTKRDQLRQRFESVVTEQSKKITADPTGIDAYSRRGDAYFFLGRFPEAVADYDKMVQRDPTRDASHWRRGIARFYAGDYKKAARQFEVYNTFDMVDRENGIWRFFSQAKAYGLEKARKNLLKYKKDDREPFPDVYRLFQKKTTPEKILAHIETAKISKTEREKRLFYAHLYIGLNHALEGRKKEAVTHLRKAVANDWGPTAGFGPNYMWHVGRVHYDRLTKP